MYLALMMIALCQTIDLQNAFSDIKSKLRSTRLRK